MFDRWGFVTQKHKNVVGIIVILNYWYIKHNAIFIQEMQEKYRKRIKEQEAKGFLSSLGPRTLLNKIPLLSVLSTWYGLCWI